MSLILLQIIFILFVAGSIGGLIGGLFDAPWENKVKLIPYKNEDCKTWYPGIFGNVLLAGMAAVIFWCLYGPYAGSPIIGSAPLNDGNAPHLTIGQLASCILIGMGGVFLFTEANRRCCKKSKAKSIT